MPPSAIKTWVFGLLLFIADCGSSPHATSAGVCDATGDSCSAARPCAAEEACYFASTPDAAHCAKRCTSAAQCAAGETCNASLGVCLSCTASSGNSGNDAGSGDAGAATGGSGAAAGTGDPGLTAGASTSGGAPAQCSSLGRPCRARADCGGNAVCVLNDGNQLTTDATAGSVTLNNLGWTHGLGFCATSCRTDPDCSGEGVEGICRLSQDSGGNLKLTITGGGNLCAPTCKQQACPAGLTCTGSLFSCGNTTDPLLCAPCGDSPVVQAETPDCKPGQLTCVDDQVSVCDCAGSWSRSACADTCSAGLCSPHLTSIVTGGQYFCGTRQNGSVSCWGKNSFGESSPPAGKLVSVTASDSTTCGLTPAGQVQCWGERPVTLAGDFKQIVRVGSGLCGVLQDGTLACAAALASDKAPPPPAGTFVELVAGYDTACARAEDGTVACWGATAMRATFTPPTGSYTAIFGGSALSEWFCGTRADQSVNCWGDQSNLMQPPAGQYASVALSSYYACAVSIDGSISCWQGPRASSGLGLPLQPPAGTSFTQIAAGDFAACALTTDNRVICWGKGSPPGENVPPFD